MSFYATYPKKGSGGGGGDGSNVTSLNYNQGTEVLTLLTDEPATFTTDIPLGGSSYTFEAGNFTEVDVTGDVVTYGLPDAPIDANLYVPISAGGFYAWGLASSLGQSIYQGSGSLTPSNTIVTHGGKQISFQGTTDADRINLFNHMVKGDANIVELGYLSAIAELATTTGFDFRSTANSVHSDYSATMRRNAGENGNFVYINLGTGASLFTDDDGGFRFDSDNEDFRISAQNIAHNGYTNYNGTKQERVLSGDIVGNSDTSYLFDVDVLNGKILSLNSGHSGGLVIGWQASDTRWGSNAGQRYNMYINNDSPNDITFDAALFDGDLTPLGTGNHVVVAFLNPSNGKFYLIQPGNVGGGGGSVDTLYNANGTVPNRQVELVGGGELQIFSTTTNSFTVGLDSGNIDYYTESGDILMVSNTGNATYRAGLDLVLDAPDVILEQAPPTFDTAPSLLVRNPTTKEISQRTVASVLGAVEIQNQFLNISILGEGVDVTPSIVYPEYINFHRTMVGGRVESVEVTFTQGLARGGSIAIQIWKSGVSIASGTLTTETTLTLICTNNTIAQNDYLQVRFGTLTGGIPPQGLSIDAEVKMPQ